MSLLHSEVGHQDGINSLVFSPDGRRLLSGSGDGTAKLWDVQTGALLETLSWGAREVNAVAWSPCGETVAVAGSPPDSLLDESELKSYQAYFDHHDRSFFDSRSEEGSGPAEEVRLFDSRTGALVNTFADYGEGVAFAPDGRTLAVVSWRSLSLIDLATGLCISRFDMGLEQDALRNVFFSEDGKHVASIGSNGVMIFDTLTASPHIIATDKCLFTDAENIENAFRVSRLPNSLDQVGPPDEAAYVAEFWRHTLPGFRPNNSSDGGMGIQRIAFSPDGKLAAIHTFGGITILDVSNGETVWFLASPDQKYLRTTAFSPDGKLLAATGDHQTIFVWSAETGKDVRRIGHPPPAITSVSFGERCILDVSRCRRFGDSFERRARLTAFAIGSFEGFSPLGATRVSASGFGL